MVEVPPVPLGHRLVVEAGGGAGAAPEDHSGHGAGAGPDRERADRSGRSHRRERQRRLGVVPDLAFDGPAPADEARQLGEAHPRDGHRDHGLTGIGAPRLGGQVRQFPDRAPAAQVLEPHMPAGVERPAEAVLGEEGFERRLVGPFGEDGEVTQLHPARGHHGCAQFHADEDFDVLQSGRRRRPQERADGAANGRFGEVERVKGHR
ncbi:hypothetical protein [Glycomyces tritici]|uniref:Uncharacterized protein n=1 Tax=Glycomyces tritici TaxID=2665176 RepID=A0ABT7YV47_9ACTN|nr:hypothetical protein [Glycomyces tritici]MDN3242510.1 hypothetical protein [Glycomyces tritici]